MEKVLWLKVGGFGDVVVDGGIMLGGLRKKHPNAKITAIVRNQSQIEPLRAIYRIDTGQSVIDYARPISRTRGILKKRYKEISRDEAWRNVTKLADWNYAYDARSYIGKVFRFKKGIPEIIYPKTPSQENEMTYHHQFSIWTHKLCEKDKTTIELMSESMDIDASWPEVGIKTPKLKNQFPNDYAILSNATDGESIDKRGKKTKQWSFYRFGKVAKWLGQSGIIPIQLGMKSDKKIPNCLDLRGKTSFIEAAEILRNAKLLVSIEGGLARLAGLVKTKSIIIFTSTPISLFKVPYSIPVKVQGSCSLKNENCFFVTGRWKDECAIEESIKFKKTEALPPCSAYLSTDIVIEKIQEILSKSSS